MFDPSEPLARRIRRLKIEEWLRTRHCVKWPDDVYYLTEPKELAAAVAFVESLFDAVN